MKSLKITMKNYMNLIKQLIIQLCIISISIFFGLILFEGFLIYDNKWELVEREIVNIEGRDYPFIKQPNIKEYFLEKNEKIDVFVIGDSFVEGIHCAAEKENFPDNLAKKLSPSTTVVNLGIGGKNPVDYIDFIKNLKLDSGDKVIVALYDNDIFVDSENCKQINKQSQIFDLHVPLFCETLIENSLFIQKDNISIAQKLNGYIKAFKTVELLKESIVNIPAARQFFFRTEYRNSWTNFEAEENKWILSSIKVINDLVIKKGATLNLTYYPNTNRIDINDPRYSQWLEFIEYVDDKLGLRIDDPYPYIINNANSSSMVWSLTDKHPSCEAHELMASHIKDVFFNNSKNE